MLETGEEVLSLNKKEKEVNLVPKLSTEMTKQDLSNRVSYSQPQYSTSPIYNIIKKQSKGG